MPQSLACLSNQTSYDGTKWLHCKILRVFGRRFGVAAGRRATAAAAPASVLKKVLRSIRLGSITRFRSPLAAASSERVHHAQRKLVGIGPTGVPSGHGPKPLQSECVAARLEAQQRVGIPVHLARERRKRRVVLGEPSLVRIVDTEEGPQAPARSEVVTCLAPGAPAPNVPLLGDVGELLSERLPVVVVSVHGEAAGGHVSAGLEAPRREVVAFDTGAGRILPVGVTHEVGTAAERLALPAEVEPRLELRQSRGLTAADGIDGQRVLG